MHFTACNSTMQFTHLKTLQKTMVGECIIWGGMNEENATLIRAASTSYLIIESLMFKILSNSKAETILLIFHYMFDH